MASSVCPVAGRGTRREGDVPMHSGSAAVTCLSCDRRPHTCHLTVTFMAPATISFVFVSKFIDAALKLDHLTLMDCLGRASLSMERKGLKSFLTEDEMTSFEEGCGGWSWQGGNGNAQARPRMGRGVSRGQSTRERSSKKAEQKIRSLWK